MVMEENIEGERLRDPITGLPIDLLAWEEIEKEQQIVRIKAERRRHKYVTIIEGLDLPKDMMKRLLKDLKSKLACGGTYKEGYILLQGDHRRKVKDILVNEWGIEEDKIELE